MPKGLHRVYMQQSWGVHPIDGPPRRLPWLDGAHLIVYSHQAHQHGLLIDRLINAFFRDKAAAVGLKQHHLKALLFQPGQGLQHGGVLNGGGNNALTPPAPRFGRAKQSQVVGLSSTGGKIDFFGHNVQRAGHRLAGGFQLPLGLQSFGVQRRGVAVIFGEHFGYFCHRLGAYPGGGAVV